MSAMDYRERKGMLYRMIHVGAWANYVPPKTQNQRELCIAVQKLQRLTEQDEFKFMDHINSLKRSKQLEQKNAKSIKLQYERIVELVANCFHDIAKKSKHELSSAELNELMYGDGGLLTEAVAYGRLHAAK